jgi:predicted Zn-dependent protease
MKRMLLIVCATALILGAGCRRRSGSSNAKDPHLERGYALLMTNPEKALTEFERSTDMSGRKQYALGQANEALGRLEAAREHYDQSIEQNPGAAAVATARARIELLQGHKAAAIAGLEQTLKTAPDELPALLLYGLIASTSDQLDRAIGLLTKWPEIKQEQKPEPSAEYWLTLAALEMERGQTSTGKAHAERGARSSVMSATGAIVLAQLAWANGKPGLARALMTRLIMGKLESPEAATLARLALGTGHVDIAQAATKSIALFPEVADNLLVLGQVELASGHADGALEHLKRGVALLAKEPSKTMDEAEFLLAQAYLRAKDVTHAAPLLRALATRAPKNLAVQLLYAELEIAQKAAPAAVQRLLAVRAGNDRNPTYWEHLADAEVAAGDRDGAINTTRAWVAAAPDDARALRRLIDLLKQNGKAEEALEPLRKAAERAPQNRAIAELRTETLMRLGKVDVVLSELQAKADTAPDDEPMWLRLAASYDQAKKPTKVRETLTALTLRHPTNVAAWLSLARLEEREHHPKAVDHALKAALAADPRCVPALRHAGEWAMRQRRWKEAGEAFEKLLAVTPEDTSALNNLAYLAADHLDDPGRAVSLAERADSIAPGRPAIEDTLGWALIRRGKLEDRKRALELLRHASSYLELPDVTLHLAVALHMTGRADESKKLLTGFTFRPGDPGHAFAQAALKGPG